MWCPTTIDVQRSSTGVTTAVFQHPDDPAAAMEQLREVSELFTALATDEPTRVILLTGVGDHFFRGPPLEAIQEMRTQPARIIAEMATARRTLQHLIDCDKPIVAAVNGPAVGLGTTLAFLADLVVAADTAVFRDPHVRLGVAAGDGGTIIWPLLLGLARAKRHLLLAEPLSATQAQQLGIVAETVPADAVMSTALRYAEKLNRMPAFALGATKAALNQWLRLAGLASGDFAYALQLGAQLTPEASETIEALTARQRQGSGGD
jgi:enoyl-CoA hydratase